MINKLQNQLYVLNKESKLEKFKELLEVLPDQINLILIKDNDSSEFMEIVKNQEKYNTDYYDNTIKNLLILDYEHISLKTKLKMIYMKENYKDIHIFRDLEAYIRDNQNNKRETQEIRKITVILNNYNEKSDSLEKLITMCKAYNFNFILLNEETDNLGDIILNNVEKK